MPSIRAKTFLTAFALAASVAAAPLLAHAQATAQPVATVQSPAPATLSLTASGEVSAAPDMATVSFGVLTVSKTASEAMKANNIRMNQVMAALKSAGIDAKDIQTSSLNLSPQYTYPDNQTPKLSGYQASNQVSVRVNDLARTGPVIDAVIAAGVNQIDSISFGLKDDSAILDKARQQAVANLNQRANLYAQAFGLKIKRVLTISENSPVYNPPMPMAAMRFKAAEADASTPVANGEMQMSVQVSATWELAN